MSILDRFNGKALGALGTLPHSMVHANRVADHEQMLVAMRAQYGDATVTEVESIIQRINTETPYNTGWKFRADLYDFDPDLRQSWVAQCLDGDLPMSQWGVLATLMREVMTDRQASRLRSALQLDHIPVTR